MTLEDFYEALKEITPPTRWIYHGKTNPRKCIRTFNDKMNLLSPLEAVLFFKGGTVSWKGGKLGQPSLIENFSDQGKVLGLSERETHAIFLASDNEIVPGTQGYYADSLEYHIRKTLIEICKPRHPMRLVGADKHNVASYEYAYKDGRDCRDEDLV